MVTAASEEKAFIGGKAMAAADAIRNERRVVCMDVSPVIFSILESAHALSPIRFRYGLMPGWHHGLSDAR
jgi:hypothetical protein